MTSYIFCAKQPWADLELDLGNVKPRRDFCEPAARMAHYYQRDEFKRTQLPFSSSL